MSGVLFYNGCRIKTGVLTEISVTEAEEKDVNFYDYDGFRLLSYTNAEALALTELPSNPIVNENLTFDGWNWTLAQIKNQINNVSGVVNVGAVYHTTDDKTHITCKPSENYRNALVCLTPTVANAVTVDWGDGTTDTWTSTSQETKSHVYSDVTSTSVYDIAISCSSGTYAFNTYISGARVSNQNAVYTDVKLSNKVSSIGGSCFNRCYSLKHISIPGGVSVGNSCFKECYTMEHITFPDSVTSIGSECFYSCRLLKNTSVPGTFVSFGDYCFQQCYQLRCISIPSGVTSVGYGTFKQDTIKNVILPDSVTSIGNYCFSECESLESVTISNNITAFSEYCFSGCISLVSIVVPSGVVSIGTECFTNCSSLKKIYCKPTTPPSLDEYAIPSGNTNMVIYVPTASLSQYTSATTWSTFSSKIKAYNF